MEKSIPSKSIPEVNRFLFYTGLLSFLFACHSGPETPAIAPPNVVLIMTGDQDYGLRNGNLWQMAPGRQFPFPAGRPEVQGDLLVPLVPYRRGTGYKPNWMLSTQKT
jgi:hypothetical protein